MNIICGLKLPGRNCMFFCLDSLTKQGKCNNLYRSYTGYRRTQVSCTQDRCQRLDLSGSTRNWSLTGSPDFYRNLIGKGLRCLLNVPNTEVYKNAHHSLGRFYFQSSWPLGEKITSLQISPVEQLPCHFSAWNVQIIRSFRTSPPFQAAPVPLFWIIVKPAQKLFAIILGR